MNSYFRKKLWRLVCVWPNNVGKTEQPSMLAVALVSAMSAAVGRKSDAVHE